MNKPKVAVLAIVLLLYLGLGGYAVVRTWMTPTKPVERIDEAGEKVIDEPSPPQFGEVYMLAATAASGVMVSAFSAAMGIEDPQVDDSLKGWGRWLAGLWRRLRWFWSTLTEEQLTKNYYVWAQIIMGVACLVTWLFRTNITPSVVKSIGSLALTMFVAVATDATTPNGT